MSTPQQDEANRRNGRLSRGPQTARGKARSAKNALKHGLLSRGVLLPDEDAEAFSEQSRRLNEDLKPVGQFELFLVERIIGLSWRLQRSQKIEAGILAWYGADVAKRRFEQKMYRSAVHTTELIELLEQAKETNLATCGEIYIDDARRTNALAALSRYDTSMERSFFKTLHALERRQALRQGKEVSVPLAIDIDVSGAEPEALRILPAREEP